MDYEAVKTRARASDPITSIDAAVASLEFSGTQCDRIAAALWVGDKTAKEISAATGLTVVQIDRRLPDLQRSKRAEVVLDANQEPVVRDGYRVWRAVGAT